MKTCVYAVRVAMFVVLTAVLLAPAFAAATEKNVWFPYTNSNLVTTYNIMGSWWGTKGTSNELLWLRSWDGSYTTTPAPVWNETSIFIPNTETSWYHNSIGQKDYQLYIHNKTASNFAYSGGTDTRIKLYMYQHDGTRINGDTTWGSGVDFLNTGTTGPNIEWNTTEECFMVSVPANQSVIVANYDNGGNNEMVIKPTTGAYQMWASIRLCQPQGYDFQASIRMDGRHSWRKTAGTTSTAWSTDKVNYGIAYDGVDLDQYAPTGYNYLKLANAREYCSDASAPMHYSTMCYVINAHTSWDELVITVYDMAGNELGYTEGIWLAPNERFHFAPNQLFQYGSAEFVSVRIIGQKPVAVALNAGWSRSSSLISSKYSRIGGCHAVPFLVNNW